MEQELVKNMTPHEIRQYKAKKQFDKDLQVAKFCYEGEVLNPNLIRVRREDTPSVLHEGEIQHPSSKHDAVDVEKIQDPSVKAFIAQNWSWKYRIMLDQPGEDGRLYLYQQFTDFQCIVIERMYQKYIDSVKKYSEISAIIESTIFNDDDSENAADNMHLAKSKKREKFQTFPLNATLVVDLKFMVIYEL